MDQFGSASTIEFVSESSKKTFLEDGKEIDAGDVLLSNW
jgi:hypothetical protein